MRADSESQEIIIKFSYDVDLFLSNPNNDRYKSSLLTFCFEDVKTYFVERLFALIASYTHFSKKHHLEYTEHQK